MRFHDRIGGDDRPLPGRHPLGRFTVAAGPELLINGIVVRPGDYIGGPRRWRARSGAATVQSEHGPQPLPDPVLVSAVRLIGLDIAERISTGRSLDDAPAVSPVIDRKLAETRLAPAPLEKAMEQHLRHLTAVCFRPAARLSPVNVLLPVSRSRRITSATVVRLAAHSEDWARLRPDGVIPERVLTPQRDINVDLYENRVAARLATHLWRHLTLRIAELRSLSGTFTDAQRLIEDAADRPFLATVGLWELLVDLVEDLDWAAGVANRLHTLERLRDEVARLRGAPLWRVVNHRADVGTTLRPTNLFTDDHRYRHVSDLWQAWLASQGGALTAAEELDAIQQWCRNFELYTGLLLHRALLSMRLTPADASAPARGGAPARYLAGRVAVALRRGDDGVYTVARDGTDVVRVVPLPHALTASGRPDVVAAELTGLLGMPSGPPTVVVYPAERAERAGLPLQTRLRVFETPGGPAPGRSAASPYPVPVSPLDVDSVVRLARVLRWALEKPRLGPYPHAVDANPADAGALAALPWLAERDGSLVVDRPPAGHERAALPAELRRLHRAADRARQRGDNSEQLDRLRHDLEAAADRTADVLRCPVCTKEAPLTGRNWQRLDEGYRVTCDSCHSVWERRTCQRCRARYPVLSPPATERPPDTAAESLDGDAIDRRFGSFVLATECWIRPRRFICPDCSTCAEAFSGNAAGCDRCAGQPPA
ncbi:hypothetical protein ACFPIJ_11335 [Dactylosporangium cerinum]|uniref:DUF2357 domain-containing protein n=1 Tax=Dactylosporangium cerinum TaxID=1434730 RepID=A0ABV9VUX2_9ACTN